MVLRSGSMQPRARRLADARGHLSRPRGDARQRAPARAGGVGAPASVDICGQCCAPSTARMRRQAVSNARAWLHRRANTSSTRPHHEAIGSSARQCSGSSLARRNRDRGARRLYLALELLFSAGALTLCPLSLNRLDVISSAWTRCALVAVASSRAPRHWASAHRSHEFVV